MQNEGSQPYRQILTNHGLSGSGEVEKRNVEVKYIPDYIYECTWLNTVITCNTVSEKLCNDQASAIEPFPIGKGNLSYNNEARYSK